MISIRKNVLYVSWLYRICRRRWFMLVLLLASIVISLTLLLITEEGNGIFNRNLSNNRPLIECDNCSLAFLNEHAREIGPRGVKSVRVRNKQNWKESLLMSEVLESSRLLSPLKNNLHHDVRAPPELFKLWSEDSSVQCGGHFVGYINQFAVMKSVVLDMAHCHGMRGGEQIKAVLNQEEESEFYRYSPGCFQISCSTAPEYFFDFELHVAKWMESMTADIRQPVQRIQQRFTVAVVRYEYANIYHTMTDWYSVFLLMQFCNRTQATTDVLLFDGHPRGQLDSVWRRLFHNVTRVSSLPRRTRFSQLVWATPGYSTPLLSHSLESVPLLEEFRAFFLESHLLSSTPRKLNCHQLDILFVWRRDYLAHPRNPQGHVGRKVANEHQLLMNARRRWPQARVHGIQLDAFSMGAQLKLVAAADILVGMHGAGLTHALFLPPHGGLVEIRPPDWYAHAHFEAIARWRHLKYAMWLNSEDETRELYSKVSLNMIDESLGGVVHAMCGITEPLH